MHVTVTDVCVHCDVDAFWLPLTHADANRPHLRCRYVAIVSVIIARIAAIGRNA